MSVTIPSSEQRRFQARNNLRATMTAFWATVRRDLLVSWREALIYLVQMLAQPLFFLFVFGKILPTTGAASVGFSTFLLPGIVAFTILVTTLQGPSIELARDLAVLREIDDRLLSPQPILLVAIEKILLSALRGLVAGALVFPLAWWILGSGYQVSTDHLAILIGLMVLESLVGAALGLLLATVAPIHLLPLVFALVLTPLIFTGCAFFPWSSLSGFKWFQVLTLFNPLTYASEGMRYAMIPAMNGQAPDTLAIGWVLLALISTFIVCLIAGLLTFRRRVVS
ncbi:MAG TPA: ABC transporter permease [Ktedonobacterales bacterium]|nr:ABC transporter permease [Ktedonobacterales bacterium]